MSQLANSKMRIKNWRPLSMSLVTHVILVVFLILLAQNSRSNAPDGELRRAGIVLAVETENEPTKFLDQFDLSEENEPTPSEPPAATLPPPPALTSPERDPVPDLPGAELTNPWELDALNMAHVPKETTPATQHQLTDEDLKLIEADQKLVRERTPQGAPATLRVFGGGGMTGRSFVFVLDRSKSMGGTGLGVIHAARKELTEAIGHLQPNHQFQIVGYHHRTVTVSRRDLLPATDANKQRVPDFISNLAAFGSTDHDNALTTAVTFDPDVIVLMTDGGYPVLNENQMQRINRMAPRGCQIHCIQFGMGPQQQTMNFMRALADQNNGTYRYVDVNQWNKDD